MQVDAEVQVLQPELQATHFLLDEKKPSLQVLSRDTGAAPVFASDLEVEDLFPRIALFSSGVQSDMKLCSRTMSLLS